MPSEHRFAALSSTLTTLVDKLMGLDNAEITERFRELVLQHRRLQAELAAVVAVADVRAVYGDDGHRSIKGWMRAHANRSGAEVTATRRTARLIGTFTAVGDALLAGHVGVAQVAELARAHGNPRCGAAIGDVLDTLLDHAEYLPFEDFRTVVRRWETLASEDGAGMGA